MLRVLVFVGALVAVVVGPCLCHVAAHAQPVVLVSSQDQDVTPIQDCDDLPAGSAIEVFTSSQATQICRQVLRTLEGVTVADLRDFEKASYLLSAKGYETGQYSKIASELVEIIRLRGLYDQRARWQPTVDIAFRAWTALKGSVSPRDIQEFLRASGKMAKTLSDEGLLNMIVMMDIQHRNGDD